MFLDLSVIRKEPVITGAESEDDVGNQKRSEAMAGGTRPASSILRRRRNRNDDNGPTVSALQTLEMANRSGRGNA